MTSLTARMRRSESRSRFPEGCGTCRTNKASQACKLRVQNTPQPHLWRAGAADRKAENTASAPAQQDWCVDTTAADRLRPGILLSTRALQLRTSVPWLRVGKLKIADAATLRCSRALVANVNGNQDTTLAAPARGFRVEGCNLCLPVLYSYIPGAATVPADSSPTTHLRQP